MICPHVDNRSPTSQSPLGTARPEHRPATPPGGVPRSLPTGRTTRGRHPGRAAPPLGTLWAGRALLGGPYSHQGTQGHRKWESTGKGVVDRLDRRPAFRAVDLVHHEDRLTGLPDAHLVADFDHTPELNRIRVPQGFSKGVLDVVDVAGLCW